MPDDLTESRLAEIEATTNRYELGETSVPPSPREIRSLCSALREAWAERNRAKAAASMFFDQATSVLVGLKRTEDRLAAAERDCIGWKELHHKTCGDWEDEKDRRISAEKRAEEALALAELRRVAWVEGVDLVGPMNLPAPEALSRLQARIAAETWREAAKLVCECERGWDCAAQDDVIRQLERRATAAQARAEDKKP